MSRVLVLIGAFLFFRAVLPRKSRPSSTAITPYMSALDGMMPPQEVSSLLDDVTPYEACLAARRAKAHGIAHSKRLRLNAAEADKPAICSAQVSHAVNLRR